jgi:hypothetical protein
MPHSFLNFTYANITEPSMMLHLLRGRTAQREERVQPLMAQEKSRP